MFFLPKISKARELGKSLVMVVATLVVMTPTMTKAQEHTVVGSACTNGQSAYDWDALFQCTSSTWQRAPVFIGGSGATTCDSSHIGLMQWTGTALAYCNGTSWVTSITTGGKIGIQTFTASGTYTPSVGVGRVFVECWGAGGGGGGNSSLTVAAGGGGGGGYAASYFAYSTTATVTIGSGGSNVAANTTGAGGNGGNSSFGATVIAAGGSGGASTGTGGAGGSTGASTGSIRMAGQTAPTTQTGGTTIGMGGSSPKNTAATWAAAATNGAVNSGQGGEGGSFSHASGTGGSGYCVITEYN